MSKEERERLLATLWSMVEEMGGPRARKVQLGGTMVSPKALQTLKALTHALSATRSEAIELAILALAAAWEVHREPLPRVTTWWKKSQAGGDAEGDDEAGDED